MKTISNFEVGKNNSRKMKKKQQVGRKSEADQRKQQCLRPVAMLKSRPEHLRIDSQNICALTNKHRKYISKQVQHAVMSIVHPELKRILKDNISDVSVQEWQKTYKIINPDYEIEPLEQAIKLASSDKKPEDKLKSISKILKSMKTNQAKGKKM